MLGGEPLLRFVKLNRLVGGNKRATHREPRWQAAPGNNPWRILIL
jgi:hypothetical protein